MPMLKGKAGEDQEAQAGGGLSIIAVGMTVRGDLECNGTVKVEGSVEGHVAARNQVLVARGGVVQGDIDAREAVVGGAANGAIRALERVEIQSGAVVNGDITTRRISVAEGGSLNGLVRMNDQAKAPGSSPAEPKPGATPGAAQRQPIMSRPSQPRQPAPGAGD